jgi:hypothetical protein
MRPSIYLTETPLAGLRSLDDLQSSIRHDRVRVIWEQVRANADAAFGAPPLTPRSPLPGRSESQARHANPDYTICHAVGQRLLNAALAHLLTGKPAYRDAALVQAEALYDENLWPDWRDLAHRRVMADLRTGMLALALALAYDWLHRSLRPDQRRWLLQGLDRRGIQPYLEGVAAGNWWFEPRNNWHTVIVGGLGIAGMALGADHPQAGHLVDLALPRLRDYLTRLGPDGEFNESPSYANSMLMPVAFFAAHRFHTHGRDNLLAAWPFPESCRWIMHLTLPPGCVVPFGDAHLGAAPVVAHVAAVADACRDPVLQGFYLRQSQTGIGRAHPPLELLWFNPSLQSASPEGRLPRGRAFPAHSGCIVSRADWNPDSSPCVVYGKAGHGAEAHGHHDAGTVCLDAFAKRLLVDLGVYYYPADFFGPNRYAYYFAAARGHNILTIGGRELRTSPMDRARIVESRFNDERDAYWQLDLTPLYDGARRVTRTVVHRLPGILAVLDEAELITEESVSLRWHTVDQAEPDADGAFVVAADTVRLAARIARLDPGPIAFRRGEHTHRPPFDRDRLGEPLEQKHESYVEATLTASACRLLSLFCVFGPGQEPQSWRQAGDTWRITSPQGVFTLYPGNGLNEGMQVRGSGFGNDKAFTNNVFPHALVRESRVRIAYRAST